MQLQDFAGRLYKTSKTNPIRVEERTKTIALIHQNTDYRGTGVELIMYPVDDTLFAARCFCWDDRIICDRRISYDSWSGPRSLNHASANNLASYFDQYTARVFENHDYKLFDLAKSADKETTERIAHSVMRMYAHAESYAADPDDYELPQAGTGGDTGSRNALGNVSIAFAILELKGIDPAPFADEFDRLTSNLRISRKLI